MLCSALCQANFLSREFLKSNLKRLILYRCKLTCAISTSCAIYSRRGIHSSAYLTAKSYKDRENEYAHSILETIPSFIESVKRHPAESGSLPILSPESSPTLIDFVQEPSSSTSNHLVFVYGTLKRGEPNNDLLRDKEAKVKFVGEAETVSPYPLVIASRYNIPYLLHQENTGHNVLGELYEVDDIMLKRLDHLECHPNYYTRLMTPISKLGSQPAETVQAWAYFLRRFRPELLSLPFLRNYTSAGPHGLPYVPRYYRENSEAYTADVQM